MGGNYSGLKSRSRSRPGRLNFTTKRGSKVYHRNKHYVRVGHMPFGSHMGTKSRMHKGRKNYTTKRGDKVFHRKGHNIRKSRRPYPRRGRSKYGGQVVAVPPVGSSQNLPYPGPVTGGTRRRRSKYGGQLGGNWLSDAVNVVKQVSAGA